MPTQALRGFSALPTAEMISRPAAIAFAASFLLETGAPNKAMTASP